MLKKLLLGLTLSCLIVFGIFHMAEAKTDKEIFETEIEPFFTALEQKDWNNFIRFFPTEDKHNFIAILTNVNPIGNYLSTVEELHKLYKPVMFNKELTSKFDANVKHYVIKGDLAYVESDNDVIIPAGNGKPKYHKLVNIVFVFKKIDDQWYFIFDYNRILKDLANTMN